MRYLIILLFLLGCSTSISLKSRGLSENDRRFYIIQNGYVINKEVRRSFEEGVICEKMPKELVFQMYGYPDIMTDLPDGEYKWTYLQLDNSRVEKYKIILEAVFTDYDVVKFFEGDSSLVGK
jgi:hypothetical protein